MSGSNARIPEKHRVTRHRAMADDTLWKGDGVFAGLKGMHLRHISAKGLAVGFVVGLFLAGAFWFGLGFTPWADHFDHRGLAVLIGIGALAFLGLGMVVFMSFSTARQTSRAVSSLETDISQIRVAVGETGGRSLVQLVRATKKSFESGVSRLAQDQITPEVFRVHMDRRVDDILTILRSVVRLIDDRFSSFEFQTNVEEIRGEIESLDARLGDAYRTEYREIEGLIQVMEVLRPQLPLGAFGDWSISADLGAHLVAHVLRHQPRMIVEAGSGISSVLMGLAVRAVGTGHVLCLEHDPMYAARTREDIYSHGLEDWVTVIDAPLAWQQVGSERAYWYDLSRIDLPPEVDLLFVDGPPGSTAKFARQPAFPLLQDRLSERASVILDDANRDEEREIATNWVDQDPSFTLTFFPHRNGTAVLTRGRPSPALAEARPNG